MDEIPELVTELPENGVIKTEQVPVVPFVPSSSTPTAMAKKIPITIVTGYLGSGKSTLLQKIGKTANKRLAIILNEFGDSSVIEKSVTIQDQGSSVQEWLDIGNGCLCCTVKDNGVTAIENLIENSKDKIDYILLETTGVADPAPIAKMFWLDDGLASNIYIDGVVTVVDAEHIIKCLDDSGGHWHKESLGEDVKFEDGITTAHLQLALADVILLNKIDKVSDTEPITERIRQINQTSPIHTTSFGDIEISKILDLHAFDVDSKLTISESSFHDDRISTVTIAFPFLETEQGFSKIENFLQHVLWDNSVNGKTVEVHRLKGLLVHGDDVRVVQGVRDTYEIIENGKLLEEVKENKLVFIGKNLNRSDLLDELNRFL
ncbi:conserved hypothetical protein [Candida dubliniensis CD36]|uniref:Uncharacterized protein n=1 Tax=Candida dubliniensis (strain CD36 / ATCC MYA-646 / CBS 7987 / NCPF 3949 / NRRL Y-17841) TaxID=573826 RepID=B9WKG1_CANDC|nr:conserved hypothetical protein [Candida dubliniensis CD36]CAX40813.1 conserved hypothetical protein [Candida dubliniensis CD36]